MSFSIPIVAEVSPSATTFSRKDGGLSSLVLQIRAGGPSVTIGAGLVTVVLGWVTVVVLFVVVLGSVTVVVLFVLVVSGSVTVVVLFVLVVSGSVTVVVLFVVVLVVSGSVTVVVLLVTVLVEVEVVSPPGQPPAGAGMMSGPFGWAAPVWPFSAFWFWKISVVYGMDSEAVGWQIVTGKTSA